jgi:hypothetical protein
MKLKLIYNLFFLSLLSILLLANAGGRAKSQNWGNTGAPGDQTLSNGNARTCQSCHATGDIQVTMNVNLLDKDNNPITAYQPEEIYTAKVSIDHAAGPMPSGYGFQIVSLFDADNMDVNGWTETGHSDNVQIATADNTNRVYAEHKNTSSSNEFLIQWKAPKAGSGTVSFYAAGNGVNGNGSTGGDGAALPVKLTLEENITSNIKELSNIGIDFNIAPNPFKNDLVLNIQSQQQQEAVNIKVWNAIGKVFYQANTILQNGENRTQIDLSNLPKGIYWLQIEHELALSSKKIIKL